MKKIKLLFGCTLSVLSLAALIGCKGGSDTTTNNQTTVQTSQTPAFDVNSVIANYKSSVEGTVKLTYKTDYIVDVNANGGNANMEAFKHHIVSNNTVEMDLGSDLYIYVKKDKQDLKVSEDVTTTEALLYKDGIKYYYLTSTTSKVEVSADKAKEKVGEIFSEMTEEQAGIITLDSLIYNSTSKDYELKNFGLTETFVASDLNDPVYSTGSVAGGLSVLYKPEYVGYHTDGGWSDFSNKTDNYAALCEVETNNLGYVTKWKETYNKASLDFAIMNPAPTVSITGTREFISSYGDTLTKKNALAEVKATAKYEAVANGTYQVKTCAMGDFANMTDVENGASIEVGKILCIKPTANEGYKVKSVAINDVATPLVNPSQAGGWYCYTIIAGENNIAVEFEAQEGVVFSQSANGTYTVSSFELNGQTPTNFVQLTSGDKVDAGKWLGVKCTPEEGYVVDSVKVNGTDATLMGGYYCSKVVEGTVVFEVVVTFKASQPVDPTATINVTNSSNVEYQLQSFVYGQNGPSNYQVITDGKITSGQTIWGAIVVSSSTSVTVTVNGTVTNVNIPNGQNIFYCFAVSTGGAYEVVITINQ